MKVNYFIHIVLFAFVFSYAPQSLLSQEKDPMDELRKLGEKNRFASSYEMGAAIYLYASVSASEPAEVSKLQVKQSGHYLHQQIGEIEIIQNENYSVYFDHSQNILGLSKSTAKHLEELNQGFIPDFEALLESLGAKNSSNHGLKAAYDIHDKLNRIVIKIPKGLSEYEKLEFYYSDDYTIRKARFHFSNPMPIVDGSYEKPVMVYDFNKVKYSATINAEDFDETKYIIFKNGKPVSGKGKYGAYRFIDNSYTVTTNN